MPDPSSPLTLTVGDRTITIAPVKVGDLPAFLRAVEPIARELAAGDIMAAVVANAERFIDATAIGAGVDRPWLEAQGVDALIDLASGVLEVNADFFARRVTPALLRATETLAQKMAGTTSSLLSSMPATATAT